jgi:hypothetical protein
MRRSLLSLAVLVLATQTAVADGVYFTESFGGTDVKNDLSYYMESAVRIRVAAGYRKRHLAFELWFAADMNNNAYYGYDTPPQPGYEISTPDGGYKGGSGYNGGYGYAGDSATDLASWGFDMKYLQPLAPNVEMYVRGGLSKGYADGLDAEGRGLGIGAGVQLKGKVPVLGFLFWPFFFTNLGPKVTAAVFVDTSYEFYRLHGPTHSTDASLNHLTLGFAVGNDF